MPQFFVDQRMHVGSEIEINGTDARHILKVLRLGRGDWLILSDGKGKSFRAEIASVSGNKLKALIMDSRTRKLRAPSPVLGLAIVKHDRTELVIQKAVELGIERIVPFRSSRTIPIYTEAANKTKLTRWQKIANEAAKQSGLPFRPVVETPVDFTTLVGMANGFDLAFMFWEGERERQLSQLKDKLAKGGSLLIIIGPEGGFSKEEVESALEKNIVTASLGNQILRVETAAIAALSICQFESGNFDL